MDCFRCPVCLTNWPHHNLYRECPQCRVPNSRIMNVDNDAVLTNEEAQHLSRQYNFEYYLATEYIPSQEGIDPELEARLDALYETQRQARIDGYKIAQQKRKRDQFDQIINGQFDEEERLRIIEIERILRGREIYNVDSDVAD